MGKRCSLCQTNNAKNLFLTAGWNVKNHQTMPKVYGEFMTSCTT